MLDTPLGGAVISILIGLLLGLEREHSQHGEDERLFAGVRTFPILVVTGYIAAFGGGHGLPWLLPVVFLAVASLAVASYVRSDPRHVGATTEAAAILAPLLGALVAWKEELLAAALAVIVTLLLTMKARLHRIAGAITGDEIVAILKFGIVAVILMPLLPAQPIEMLGGVVPRQIGLVVVVLSAVSLVGYLLVRMLGGRIGWSLAGMLGGLVSSTAVALSFSGKVRTLSSHARCLAAGIILASTILYARCFVVLALFDWPLAAHLAPALGILLVIGLLLGYLAVRASRDETAEGIKLGNPVELGQALLLALLFSAILIGARFAETYMGTRGLWATGLIGGLIDIDSVVVAAASLRGRGIVSLDVAAATCLLGTISNLCLKGALVVVIGRRALARHVVPAFLVLAVLTLFILRLT